jgi:hypothetical protein
MDPVTGSHLPGFVAALEARGAAAVIAETEACPGERILVSNEDLAQLLPAPMPAGGGRSWGEALRDAAAGRFAVTVIVYVRRQDFLKESLFAQSAKIWYWGDIRDEDHFDLDIDGKLRAIEAIFGRDRVRPVVYDDLRPGDIVAPLLAELGLDIDKGALAPVGRENASMPRRKLLFLAGFPKPATARWSQAERFPAGFVARVLAGSDAVADDGERFLMSPAERHALVAAHLEGNRALVARHGIADPGGFVALPDPDAPWNPPAPIALREVAAVWRESLAAARAGRDPLRAAWLAARLSRPFAAMAARVGRGAARDSAHGATG